MSRGVRTSAVIALLTVAVAGIWYALNATRTPESLEAVAVPPAASDRTATAGTGPRERRMIPVEERRNQGTRGFTLWIDPVPEQILAIRQPTGESSNIHPDDYTGPAACRECHRKQYDSWSTHAHRWMNALADATTVKGDFSDRKMSYLGGEITFAREGDGYRMRLVRGDVRREYVVNQTIGSRFFQYYVGRQLTGPEPADHPLYREDYVLPVGYWLDRQEWVPTVHV